MGLDKIEKQGSGKRKNVNVLTPGTKRVKYKGDSEKDLALLKIVYSLTFNLKFWLRF